jgi:subtilisin family serine protease
MNETMKQTTRIRIFSLGCLLAFGLWAMFTAPLSQAGGGAAQESRRQGEVTVCVRPGSDINKVNARHGTYVKNRIPGSTDYLLGLPARVSLDNCLRQLRSDPDLLFAEPNYNFRLPEVRQVSQAFIDQVSQAFIDGQAPASFYGQPALVNLNLSGAHAYSRGAGVRVAVLDTGLDFDHPLFAGRIASFGYDYVDNDGVPTDEPKGAGYGHGTFVAGLIAMTAPSATIMPLRVFNRDGIGTSFDIAKAIRFAADNGATVINMSFGLMEQDELIREALNYAYGRAYMIASAGNDNRDFIQFPADFAKVLSVTASAIDDLKAPFANYNRQMAVIAPGVLLYSAYPGKRWAWWSGTSFSTPLVAGESALLLGLKSGLTPSDLNRLITTSGANIDPLNPSYQGKLGRRIDFRAAIDLLLSGQ